MSLSKEQLEQVTDELRSLDMKQLLGGAIISSQSKSTHDSAPQRTEPDARHPATLLRPISPPPSRPNPTTTPPPPPLRISLTSLHPMHAPSKTSILYAAPTDPSDRLYPFCNALRTHFTSKHFLVPDERPLRLHATIVNTIYVKGRDREAFCGDAETREQQHHRRGRRQGPLKFDTTALVRRYAGFEWVRDVLVDRVAICEMGAKEVRDQNGEVVDSVYNEVVSVPI
ncbi:hypothetical protein ANO11243_026060 [Dothideomycetidae sp. 11243]|nr:hypothetical protein ANO11243_026060 [fungal sp. No.11243]